MLPKPLFHSVSKISDFKVNFILVWVSLRWFSEIDLGKLFFFKECSNENYNGVDFANFFVWGNKNVTTMAIPDCKAPCNATDVVADTSKTCDTVKSRNIIFNKLHEGISFSTQILWKSFLMC